MSEAEYLPPAVAAERLHVSASGLRRLAPIYEAVYGELPRTGRGAVDKQARLWPVEAVDLLDAARRVVETDKQNTIRRYGTIQKALEGLRDGLIDPDALEVVGTAQAAPDAATQHALQVLLEEVRGLRREVAELRDSRELPPAEVEVMNERLGQGSTDGVLVRLARRVERLLWRKS